MQKLNDEELDNVAGGFIFNAVNISGADKNNPWEVINEKGDTIGRYSTKEEAIYNAGKQNQNYIELNWNQVVDLRKR